MKDFSHLEPSDYLRIPWKRRWYFLVTAVVVIAGGFAYAWQRPNLYKSITRIQVESATLLDDPLSASSAIRDRTEERVNAIRQLLEGRTILERIIEEFRLRSYDSSISMEEALLGIRSRLEVSKAGSSATTFAMAYSATDPQAAQAITRRLAEILIQANQTFQKDRAIDKDQFLEQELTQAQLDLAAADEKIKQFKAAHLGELPEQSAANMNALNGLQTQWAAINNALDRDNDQKKVLEFRLQELGRIGALSKSLMSAKEKLDTPDVGTMNRESTLAAQLAAKRSQLAEITARYTSKHPDVIRLSKEVQDLEQRLAAQNSGQAAAAGGELTALSPTEAVPSAAPAMDRNSMQAEMDSEAEIAQVKYELDTLKATISRREKEREGILKDIGQYQSRLNLAPALEQEQMTLIRGRESKLQQVANLETRKFNSQMAANAMANTKYETYRILDEANLPESPVPPAQLQLFLMAIGAGLGAGLVAAFAREFLEPSLSNEEEAAAILKLPVLASIPEIPSGPRALANR